MSQRNSADVLAAVQAGAWHGPSAERYVAAHVPYLAWLMQASANSAAEGGAAGDRRCCLRVGGGRDADPARTGRQPRHPWRDARDELFGINTIPIAINEADYARMWVQAATTMTTYQAVSTSALAAAPQTEPAPHIVNSNSARAAASGSGDSSTLPIIDDDSGDPYTLSWYVNRITEVTQTLQRDIGLIGQNPAQGLTQLSADIGGLVSDEVGHVGEFVSAFPEVYAIPLIVPAAAVGGLGGWVAGSDQPEAAPIPVDAPAPTPHTAIPAAGGSPVAVGAPGPAPTVTPAPAPTSSRATVVSSMPSPTPPPAGPGFVPPYAVGPPGIGSGWGMPAAPSAGDKKKAAEPYVAAAAAAAAGREQHQSRRRRRAGVRGYSHEFMEMNINVDRAFGAPAVTASDRGAGSLGFAGTVHEERSASSGFSHPRER